MRSREEIVSEIKNAKKYRDVELSVISRIVDKEYDKHKNDKLLVKEVKNKLHQIHEIFLNSEANMKTKSLLVEERYDDILKLHMSTLERFNFYSDFYKEIFLITGRPDSILDLACGYNPFSIKYMDLNKGFKYYAYDINIKTNELLNAFFKKNDYDGISYTVDLSVNVPDVLVDICFIFKFLPILEQQNKSFSTELLKKINANYIVVSFPTKSVTGRNVGMLNNYREMFRNVISNDFKELKELLFDNELVYIIRKND